MRILAILAPIAALVACSDSSTPAPKAEAAAATALSPGQWEVTRELTSLTKLDDGAASIPDKVGTRHSLSVCLAAADAAKPPADLLTGIEGGNCTQDSLYLAGGRINAAYSCSPGTLSGKLLISSGGTFTADTADLELTGATQLAGTGDVRIAETVTARRTGDCPAT